MSRRPTPSTASATTRRPATALSAALAVLILAGCAVGPDYRRPETPLPETFAAADGAPTAAAIDRQWWKLFDDATLDGLVEQALKHNHDLAAATARVEEAEGLAREAGASYFPQIDLSAGSSRSQASLRTAVPTPSTAPRLRDTRRVALSTSFEIDLWGRLRRADEAARAELLASRYARDTVELSVASLVTNAYIGLRAADAGLALTQSTLDSRRKALDITRNRYEGGAASPIDMHQAESSFAAAEAQLADFRRQRALAESQLALLTGRPGLAIAAGELKTLPLPPTPPAGLPSALLERRPDVRQAEESLVSANARIGVAKAALFPTVSLTGTLGSESAALADLFSSGAGIWSLGIGALMPIFDAGRNAARIDQADARQKQVLASYRKTVETAFKEVHDALVSLRENSASDRAQGVRASAARKTLDLAQLRYEAGYSAFLEVLDAQRSANDAQLAQVSARQAQLGSAVALFKALGGGWQDEYRQLSLDNTGERRQTGTQ